MVQGNTFGFVLPIGLRSATELSLSINTDFSPVFIAWAGTGEPCCTGAEVRGSTAKMW